VTEFRRYAALKLREKCVVFVS